MKASSCFQVDELRDFLEESMEANRSEQLSAHLADCQDCQDLMHKMAVGGSSWDQLENQLRQIGLDDETSGRIRSRLHRGSNDGSACAF